MPIRIFTFQARNINNTIVGHFETSDAQTKLMDCDAVEHNTVTHNNNNKKSTISVTWIAPEAPFTNYEYKF